MSGRWSLRPPLATSSTVRALLVLFLPLSVPISDKRCAERDAEQISHYIHWQHIDLLSFLWEPCHSCQEGLLICEMNEMIYTPKVSSHWEVYYQVTLQISWLFLRPVKKKSPETPVLHKRGEMWVACLHNIIPGLYHQPWGRSLDQAKVAARIEWLNVLTHELWWALFFTCFNFTLPYRPWSKNTKATTRSGGLAQAVWANVGDH